MKTILILGCGTQGLAISRALYKEHNRIVLIYGDKNNYADSSRYIHKKYYTPYNPLNEDFVLFTIDVIKKEKVDTLIPMGDIYAEMMSKYQEVLSKYIKYQMPSYDVFMQAYDKEQLMSICKDKAFPHPFTITGISCINEIKETDVTFPLLIKPNITCGARGMCLVNNYQELIGKFPMIQEEFGGCHLQKYIKPGGAQVEVQLFINKKKELVNSSVISKYRWYPEKGGSSCCAISVNNERIVNILYDLLKSIGWVGFADFDTIEDPETGELLIMELNPRVPACVKAAIKSGINWGQIIVDGYLGNPQNNYLYKPGEVLRHLGLETLWFLKSRNRWNMNPSYFNFFGKHIHYQDMSDISDPIPFIKGTIHNLLKVLSYREKEKINRL